MLKYQPDSVMDSLCKSDQLGEIKVPYRQKGIYAVPACPDIWKIKFIQYAWVPFSENLYNGYKILFDGTNAVGNTFRLVAEIEHCLVDDMDELMDRLTTAIKTAIYKHMDEK